MRLPLFFLMVLAACLNQGLGQTPGPQYKAEMLRTMKGRGIDADGFASVDVPLQKGATYDVVKRGVGQIVLNVDGRNVIVSPREVLLSEKPLPAFSAGTGSGVTGGAAPAVAVGPGGFVPGKLVVLSARYSLSGNQSRNVKSKVEKMIPPGDITRPVEILVSDQLSHAAQNEPTAVTQGVAVITPEVVVVGEQTKVTGRNVLTVEYLFNNQRLTKQAFEGTTMVLP